MTDAIDTTIDIITLPYVEFVVLKYRLMRFIHQPMSAAIEGLQHPQWIAEFLLACPLFILGIMLETGITGRVLAKVMPIEIWSCWLILIGGAHLVCIFWGTRRARLICSIFHPWVYACLLVALGLLADPPLSVVAFLGVSLLASILIPFTLRDQHGKP